MGDLRRLTPVARDFGFARGTPVDRVYIERFLSSHRARIAGRVLEIGGNDYTLAFGGGRVTRGDVLHVSDAAPPATIVADLTGAPHVADETFDCIICTQTLQLIYDLRAALATLHRILKPGGTLLATFPGISQIDDAHWSSSWCWSFTPFSARRLFGEAFGEAQVEVASYGNVLAAVAFLHGIVMEELAPGELDPHDPAFPLLIGACAIRGGVGAGCDLTSRATDD
jgi:SAM-dependent methyltransferase